MIPALIVDAVAAARITRLVTMDVISEPVRGRLIRAAYLVARGEDEVGDRERDEPYSTWTERAADDREAPSFATLLVCPWCTGFWVAVGVVGLRRRARWWPAVSEAFAVAYAAGILAGRD